MTPPELFPFGQPVLPRLPSADGPRRYFLLGAYPSAIHVRWAPPEGRKPIQAMPVDNEPQPFWTGTDQASRIQQWQATVAFEAQWGAVKPAGRLNGSSGRWLDDRVLAPLGLSREEVWMTDCLTTYRRSVGVHARIQDTYNPFAEREGLPVVRLAEHPTEAEIIAEATAAQQHRLVKELEDARPERMITLGRAALTVLQRLVEVSGKQPSLQARPQAEPVNDGYGQPVKVRVGKRAAWWLPLAHPAEIGRAHV